MFRGRTDILLIFIVGVFFAWAMCASRAYAQAETGEEYAFKIALERHIEDRLFNVLKEVTALRHLAVVVNAEIVSKAPGEKDDVVDEESARRALDSTYILPGVPPRNTFSLMPQGSFEVGGRTIKVDRLHVAVMIDEQAPDEISKIVHDVAINIAGYNPDRGDILDIRRTRFYESGYDWKEFMAPTNVFLMIIAVFGALFLLVGAIFFMNPFKKLSIAINDINWSGFNADASGGGSRRAEEFSPSAATIGAIDGLSIASPAPPRVTPNGGSHKRPFSFISASNINELSYLLKDGSVEDLSLIVNYIAPELAATLLSYFPTEMQTEIVLGLSATNVFSASRVEELESTIRKQLDFVVGGEDRLAAILNMADDELRERVVEKLEQQDFTSARGIMKKVRNFESIMRGLSATGIQSLVRKSSPHVLAALLSSSPGDVQKKVLESLSPGATEIVMEEMKYSKKLAPARIKQEKQAIVKLYVRLLEEGLIDEVHDTGGGV